MKFSVLKKDIGKALNIVSKATLSKSTYPSLEGILIEANGLYLNLYATNTWLGINTTIQASIQREGITLINARILNDIIRTLSEELIEFDIDENGDVTIKTEKSKFNIKSMDYKTYPNKELYNNAEFIKIKSSLIKSMIRESIFACAQIESISPILTGVLIETNNEDIKFVAIDGFRMAIRNEKIDELTSSKLNCIVPSRSLNEVLKILSIDEDEYSYIYITDKKFVINVGKTQIVSNLLQGSFINYKDIIPKENKTIIKINKSELLSSCERAMIMSDEGKNNPIKMSLENDLLTITLKSEIGDVLEKQEVKQNGEDLQIGFNPKYFIDVLKIIEDERITIEFSGSNAPCLIKPINSLKYVYLIMPVRIN